MSGGEPETTNNRMEMTAVIKALGALIEPCEVTLHTDSRYVIDGMTKWIHGWQKKGWINASKQPVRNADLWHELIEAARPHRIHWDMGARPRRPCRERTGRQAGQRCRH